MKPAIDTARTDDAVTFARRELKFALPEADAVKIIAVLSMNLEPAVFGDGRDSKVNSIYFDDEQLVSCRESMDGVSRRTKVRLRWYDSPFAEEGSTWFELKHRRNVTIAKERHPVTLDRPLDQFTYEDLHGVITDALDDPVAVEWLEQRRYPAVMVTYRRRHFRDSASGIRVTVDHEIRGFDQLGFRSPARRFATSLQGLTVIEVKTPVGDELMAGALLYPLKPRLTRSSKYASCCSKMGWRILSEPHD